MAKKQASSELLLVRYNPVPTQLQTKRASMICAQVSPDKALGLEPPNHLHNSGPTQKPLAPANLPQLVGERPAPKRKYGCVTESPQSWIIMKALSDLASHQKQRAPHLAKWIDQASCVLAHKGITAILSKDLCAR